MRRALIYVAAAGAVLVGGYLAAVLFVPRDEPDQSSDVTFPIVTTTVTLPSFEITESVPGVGTGGLTGTGTRQP